MKSTDRKNSFQWIGQMFKSKAFLVGLRSRSDINISDIEEAKSFIVGTIRGYHSEKHLKNASFLVKDNLYLSINYKYMCGMLFEQKIDFILTNFVVIDSKMKSIGFNKKDIKPFVELHNFPGDLFIATGLKTSNTTVANLSDALQQIKVDGTYKKSGINGGYKLNQFYKCNPLFISNSNTHARLY